MKAGKIAPLFCQSIQPPHRPGLASGFLLATVSYADRLKAQQRLQTNYIFQHKYRILAFTITALIVFTGAPKTNRTSDLPLRRGLLYPLSYRGVAGILPNPAWITEQRQAPACLQAHYDAGRGNTC